MSDAPADHPDRIPGRSTTEYGIYVMEMRCGHWAVMLMFAGQRMGLGHFDTRDEANAAGEQIAPGFMACVMSMVGDGDEISDMTSAGQAMLDIADQFPPV